MSSGTSRPEPDRVTALGFGEQVAEGAGLARYRDLVVGPGRSWAGLALHELLTTIIGPIPGLLGLGLRRSLYPLLFARIGRGVALGVDLSLRQPGRISLGDRVMVDDGCQLSVRGGEGVAIRLDDRVFLGRHSVLTTRAGTIEIGERSSISACCRIASTGRIQIGRLVQVAAYAYIGGGQHRIDRTDVPIMEQGFLQKGGVEIGDDVWIGAGAIIQDGVKIGSGAVVGAGAVVTEEIPPYAVAVGMPARVVRDRRKGEILG